MTAEEAPVGEWVTSETRGRRDCRHPSCEEPHFSMRLCRTHFQQARALGNMPPRPEMVECRTCRGVLLVAHTGPVPVYCRPCRKAQEQARSPHKASRYRQRVLRKYGLRMADWDALMQWQGGVCAICAQPPNVGHGRTHGNLSIDHDHASGDVRGLLCHHCNLMLGNARDSVDVLLRAVVYLNRATA